MRSGYSQRTSMALWIVTIVTILIAISEVAMAAEPQSTFQKVLQRGKIIVGTNPTVPPMAYVQNGKLVGIDIDIAKLIGKSLFGKPGHIEFKTLAWPARWAAVSEGDVDFGVMSTTIWPDRLARVNFTMGYIKAGLGVLTSKKLGVTSQSQLDSSKYTIAHLNTPSEFDIMKRYFPKAQPLVLSSEADMFTALQTGRADALLADNPTVAWRAKNQGGLVNLGPVGPPAQDAIFLRQGDFQWWYYLNAMVAEMRCGSLYPEYSAIYKKYLGVEPPPAQNCIAFSKQDLQNALGISPGQ